MVTPRTHTLRIGDVEIALREVDNDASPIVLVHGNSMCARSFDAQLAGPLAKRWRLVAMDLPGHGTSPPARETSTYTIPSYGSLVAGVLDALELEGALVVGHSLGGHAAMAAIGHPRVAGVLVFGAPPLESASSVPEAFTMPAGVEALFAAEVSAEQARAAAALVASDAFADRVISWMLETDGRARAHMAAAIGAGEISNEVEALTRAAKPFAIVHGSEDPLVSLDYLRSQESLPGLWRGAVQVIEGAGHSPQMEAPAAFDELVLSFATDVAAA